jgi:hypothetical protein
MKMLFSSADIRSIGLVRSALDGAGIAYDVRNETMPYPGAVFQPEVWIVEEGDFAQATELRDAAIKLPEVPQAAWTCPSCGEQLEGQFSSCWKCGATRNVDT